MALKLGIIGIRGRSVIFIRVGAVQHINAAGKNGEAKKGKIGVWGEGGGTRSVPPGSATTWDAIVRKLLDG